MKKFLQIMKKKKANNKGFSLVELIIVIAIMAILVGIVGTQVIPYLNKSKEAKDLQLVNSYSTAAVSAYSSNVNKFAGADVVTGEFDVYANGLTGDQLILAEDIKVLTGYAQFSDLYNKLGSRAGQTATMIKVSVDTETKKATAALYSASGRVSEIDIVTSEL